MIDTNTILRAYLAADLGIIALFAPDPPRVYCPRLPENAPLPAIGFFTRGGSSNPHIPELPSPSVQIDCWATDIVGPPFVSGSIKAREVYRAVYDALQGIQQQAVVIGVNTYYIKSAREEVQGVDMVDVDMPNYFRVLTFFEIIVA